VWRYPPAPSRMYTDVRAINELVQRESAFTDAILHEVGKVIVGQEQMIERILIGLLTGGHVLLEGVPGLAKTLTVKTVCETIAAKFSRIQFTPDMLPADVVGTVIYNQQRGEFSAKKGPIFANLVLADEINRAPAKVQSALLEAMQEKQVTIGDTTYKLPRRSWSWRRRTRWSRRAPTRCPRRRSTASCSTCSSATPRAKKSAHHGAHDQATPSRGRRTGRGRAPWRSSAVASTEQVLKARETSATSIVDDKINDYIIDVVGRDARPEEGRPQGPARHGRARRLAARQHRPEPRSARARVRATAATSRPRTSRPWAPTCCGTASSSPTRPRPRRSPAIRWCAGSSTVEVP
jgi:MoxR-like ATPase